MLDKIRSTGMGGISADDPNAIEKLQAKLEKLEATQEMMKAVNGFLLGLHLTGGRGIVQNAVDHVLVLLGGQLGGTQGIFP
mgnify:CR=1 FL=1